jgi:TPR repeat protein
MLKSAAAGFLLAVALGGPVIAGPREDASGALQRGDDAAAMRLLLPFANQGDAEAQYQVSDIYYRKHTAEDMVVSAVWVRKAAEQGHAGAQVRLGFMYNVGQGMSRDPPLAAVWYRKAADQNNVMAQLFLAGLYTVGAGVQKDFAIASSWYQRAAALGDEGALAERF